MSRATADDRGAKLGLALKEPVAGANPKAMDGTALSAAHRALSGLCLGLGVIPLDQFTSASTEQRETLHEAGLPSDRRGVQEIWFDAGQGLRTVQALLAHLRDNPGDVAQAERVVAALVACERVLMLAHESSVPFHFTADA